MKTTKLHFVSGLHCVQFPAYPCLSFSDPTSNFSEKPQYPETLKTYL